MAAFWGSEGDFLGDKNELDFGLLFGAKRDLKWEPKGHQNGTQVVNKSPKWSQKVAKFYPK